MGDERQQKHEQLAGFFSGRWAGVSKPYSQSLRDVLAHAINSMPIDAGSERFVPPMPLITSGAWCDADQQPRLNTRRIHEMVHHMMTAPWGLIYMEWIGLQMVRSFYFTPQIENRMLWSTKLQILRLAKQELLYKKNGCLVLLKILLSYKC